MTQLSDGDYRGAVIYADFSEARPGEVVDAPLNFAEVRDFTSVASQLGGLVLESTPRKLYAFLTRAEDALTLARHISRSIAQARDRDLGRLALDARVILGYGAVSVQQGRLRSEWTFRLAGLVTSVPQNSIGALRDFVGQFPPGAIDPPPRPSARSDLMILPLASSEDPVTRMASSSDGGTGVFLTLTLRVRGIPHTVRSSDCPILIGRDKSCAVQVSGDTASRVHGRIEFQNDKFYYVDDSRNGSYVLTASGQEVLLNREKIVLVGEGAISPGAPLSQQTGEVVRYVCTASQLKMAGLAAASEADRTKPMRTQGH